MGIVTTNDVAGLALIVGLGAVVVGIMVREQRAFRARQIAAAEGTARTEVCRAPNPPSDISLLRERIDELEVVNAARFDSLKARIFWTPLLWAAISGVIWASMVQCAKA